MMEKYYIDRNKDSSRKKSKTRKNAIRRERGRIKMLDDKSARVAAS